ncbi:cytochrome c [Kordiimonas marina]|uniref:cytochrome c n=1 Tax=Kordiimonas marina TaxID=2872312 RepID=UPI001FF120F3|nr:cytochrome c [Kordiimonas marina]MCJ9430104.1 cytochrome c [Kordiimonas marina]
MKLRFLTAGIAAAAITGALAIPATAHSDEHEKPFAESKYRMDNMKITVNALHNIVQHFKGQAKEDGDVAKLAEIWAVSASMVKGSFAKDTRGMEGATDAKADIWENWADFAKRADDYAADVKAFADAARTGGDIQGTFKQAASHCKSCHDKYKED